MMSVCFIDLFFWYASAYPVKIPGKFKHKKSFDGGITVLCYHNPIGTPVKARILVQDIIASQRQFDAFVLFKTLNQFSVPKQARIVSWESFAL